MKIDTHAVNRLTATTCLHTLLTNLDYALYLKLHIPALPNLKKANPSIVNIFSLDMIY